MLSENLFGVYFGFVVGLHLETLGWHHRTSMDVSTFRELATVSSHVGFDSIPVYSGNCRY